MDIENTNKTTNPDGSQRPELGNARVADCVHISQAAHVYGATIYGGVIHGGVINYGATIHGGVIHGGVINDGAIIYGGVINDGRINGGSRIYGGIIHGGVIHCGGEIYGGEIYGGEIYGEIRGGVIHGGIIYGTVKAGEIASQDDIVQFFALGERRGWTIAHVIDGVIHISAGCFYGTFDEFIERLQTGTAKQLANYTAVLPIISQLLERK